MRLFGSVTFRFVVPCDTQCDSDGTASKMHACIDGQYLEVYGGIRNHNHTVANLLRSAHSMLSSDNNAHDNNEALAEWTIASPL